MTHDPLCPTHSIDSTCADHCDDQCLGYQDCYQRCHCSLIAKVRDSAQLSPLSSVLAAISEGTATAHRPPTHRQRLTNDKPTIDDPMAHDPGVQTSSEVADSATSGASLAPSHDPMCYFNRPGGEFDFMADRCARCDLIAAVRSDEAPKAVTRWVEQGAASDDWMKVWQVREYAEELEERVRADERGKVVSEFMSNHGDPATFHLGYNTALDKAINVLEDAWGTGDYSPSLVVLVKAILDLRGEP